MVVQLELAVDPEDIEDVLFSESDDSPVCIGKANDAEFVHVFGQARGALCFHDLGGQLFDAEFSVIQTVQVAPGKIFSPEQCVREVPFLLVVHRRKAELAGLDVPEGEKNMRRFPLLRKVRGKTDAFRDAGSAYFFNH